jgi:hypothetical protein
MMSLIKEIFPSLGMNFGRSDDRNQSATKKGPGRKHKQGATKGKSKGSTYKRSAVSKVQVQQQTDNVANTPLKSATRGG